MTFFSKLLFPLFQFMIEPFLILGKSTTGQATAKLIQDAISLPGVYVFSDLLQVLRVEPELQDSFTLLQIFSYGTLQEYRAWNRLPLKPPQLHKLKLLTLITLCSDNKILSYDELLAALELDNVRELEDLVIEAIYKELVTAKLDVKSKVVFVSGCISRDLKPNEIQEIHDKLHQWNLNTRSLIDFLNKSASNAATALDTKMKDEDEFRAKVKGFLNLT
jgi:COP9 signalosome complex subunit 7